MNLSAFLTEMEVLDLSKSDFCGFVDLNSLGIIALSER